MNTHHLKTRAGLLAIVAALAWAPNSQASLIWVFNTTAETFSLTGTTDGNVTTSSFGSGTAAVWTSNVTIAGGANSISLTNGMATYNSPTPILISNEPNNNFAGYQQGDEPSFCPPECSEVRFSLAIAGATPPAPATITGNGVAVSYSGWNVNVKNYFASLTQANPLILTPNATYGGSGAGNMLVYAAPVPVPAAIWLFGSALGVMGWMRRKAAA